MAGNTLRIGKDSGFVQNGTTCANTAFDSFESTIIEKGVTKIGYEAFKDCIGLSSIVIPDSVTEIGVYAFGWRRMLANVTFRSGFRAHGMLPAGGSIPSSNWRISLCCSVAARIRVRRF